MHHKCLTISRNLANDALRRRIHVRVLVLAAMSSTRLVTHRHPPYRKIPSVGCPRRVNDLLHVAVRGDGGGGSQKGKGVREHLQLYLGPSSPSRRGFCTLATPCIPPHALPRPARPTGTLHTATKCQRATMKIDRQGAKMSRGRSSGRLQEAKRRRFLACRRCF